MGRHFVLPRNGRSATLCGHAKAPGCWRRVNRPRRRASQRVSARSGVRSEQRRGTRRRVPGIVGLLRGDRGSARPAGPFRWTRGRPGGSPPGPRPDRRPGRRLPGSSALGLPVTPSSALRGRDGPVGREALPGALRRPDASGTFGIPPGLSGPWRRSPGFHGTLGFDSRSVRASPESTRGPGEALGFRRKHRLSPAGALQSRRLGRRSVRDRCGRSLPSHRWSERRRKAS
jgi:hypothetical protein